MVAQLTPGIFQAVPAALGEGPCWHPQRQSLWWVDITAGKIFEAGVVGTAAPRVMGMGQMVGAIALTWTGDLVAALHTGIYLIDATSGTATLFVHPPGHDPQQFRFNDAKVDPQGRFWAGTLALDGRRGESCLYRITADRATEVMLTGLSVSNGLAWSPDGGRLYCIDSPTRQVRSYGFDQEKGVLDGGRVAISLAEADGWPDGCCMDAEGCLWVAHWGAAKVTRWEPESGRLLGVVPLPVGNVTSCAFGGPKLDRLFITTAVDDKRSKPEPEAGFVFCLDPGVAGLAVAPFAGG